MHHKVRNSLYGTAVSHIVHCTQCAILDMKETWRIYNVGYLSLRGYGCHWAIPPVLLRVMCLISKAFSHLLYSLSIAFGLTFVVVGCPPCTHTSCVHVHSYLAILIELAN